MLAYQYRKHLHWLSYTWPDTRIQHDFAGISFSNGCSHKVASVFGDLQNILRNIFSTYRLPVQYQKSSKFFVNKMVTNIDMYGVLKPNVKRKVNLEQAKQKISYDKRSRDRNFKVGGCMCMGCMQ